MWGCLTLAGLLLAGCSFAPGGSAGSDRDSDAGGGFSDGLPDPDGGPGLPDGAGPLPDAPPPVEPVLLETLIIDVTEQDPIASTVVLAAGHTYQLIASGEAVVRDDDLGRFEGDADYWYNSTFFGDRAGDVDMGLAVNDFDGDDSRAPNWGDFNDSHVYQATVAGNDAVLTAQFFDPDFGNGNSGSLTLEIWGPP